MLLAVTCVVLALAGCARPPAQAAATGEGRPSSAGEELVILSPHNEYIRYEFGHGFERWYQEQTGKSITVDWRDMGGTSDDVKYIRSSFAKSPEGIAIDLFFGGGVPPYELLANEGLFQPYQLPQDILDRVPARYPGGNLYDPAFRYYGSVLSSFGILYNREVLRRLGLPEPQSWEDLAAPEALSWVGMADPRSSGSALMVFEIILQAYGWEKGWDVITRLGANSRYFTASAAAIPKDVALGEVAMGGAIDFYARTALAHYGAQRLGFVLPAGKTVVNPDPIAILRGAPHLDLAQAFLRFVMSEEGQRLWFLPPGADGGPTQYQLLRMPVLADLYTRYPDLAGGSQSPFEWKTDFLFEDAVATRRRGILADLLGAFIIDTHYELVPAWKACIAAGLRPGGAPRTLAELTRMPISGDAALNLAKKWEDPVFVESRIRTITEWCRFAVKKYRQARAAGEAEGSQDPSLRAGRDGPSGPSE